MRFVPSRYGKATNWGDGFSQEAEPVDESSGGVYVDKPFSGPDIKPASDAKPFVEPPRKTIEQQFDEKQAAGLLPSPEGFRALWKEAMLKQVKNTRFMAEMRYRGAPLADVWKRDGPEGMFAPWSRTNAYWTLEMEAFWKALHAKGQPLSDYPYTPVKPDLKPDDCHVALAQQTITMMGMSPGQQATASRELPVECKKEPTVITPADVFVPSAASTPAKKGNGLVYLVIGGIALALLLGR